MPRERNVSKMDDRVIRLQNCSYPKIIAALLIDLLQSWFIAKRYSHTSVFASYVDPGSGLLIWQLVAATAAGFVFNIRKRITRFFK